MSSHATYAGVGIDKNMHISRMRERGREREREREGEREGGRENEGGGDRNMFTSFNVATIVSLNEKCTHHQCTLYMYMQGISLNNLGLIYYYNIIITVYK